MKGLIAFLATLAIAQGSHDLNTVRVRFDIDLFHYGSKNFFELPTTCQKAIAEGWTLEERPENSYLPSLKLYCYSDKTVCILVDDICNFAGMQVALKKSAFKNCNEFDDPAIMASRGYKNWIANVDGTQEEFFTICFFTIDQAALDTSVEERIIARINNDRILQNGHIWLEGPGGIRKISTKLVDLENDGTFTEQAFIPCMGRHRYYNMSTSATCHSNNMYPWFPITHEEELVALGLMNFGEYPHPTGEGRFWFEEPSRSTVEMIVPRGPKCLYELVDQCGIITMHIYFLNSPCTNILWNH